MRRGALVILGLCTLWLPVYAILFHFWLPWAAANDQPSRPFPFEMFIAVHGLTLADGLALFFFYRDHLRRNMRVDDKVRRVWEIALLFGAFVTMPIYFFKYIVPERN